MKPRSYLAATLLLLAGCASQVPTVKTQIVKIPVPVQVPCPAPVLPPAPHYMQPAGSSSEIIKTLVIDFGLALQDSRSLRAMVLGSPLPSPSTPATQSK